MNELITGQTVVHERFGRGQVEFPRGETAFVRFKHGIEECAVSSLQVQTGIEDLIRAGRNRLVTAPVVGVPSGAAQLAYPVPGGR